MSRAREFTTHYFTNYPNIESQGFSCTEEGALRGAVVHLFTGQYRRATVHKNGVLVFTLIRRRHTIGIFFGRAVR